MTDLQHRLDHLRRSYAASLRQKHEQLDAAWNAFAATPVADDARREVSTQIHRLAGSASAYGYERIGECARAADRLLNEFERTPPAARPSVDVLAQRLVVPVQQLLDEIDLTIRSKPPPVAAPDIDTRLRVLLIEDDPGQAMLIGAQLEARGCVVRVERGTDGLWQALALWPCHAIVLDYWLRGETAADIVPLLRSEPRFAHIALVCSSLRNDERLRRDAIAVGCDDAVGKAEGPDRLLDVLRVNVARADRSARRFG